MATNFCVTYIKQLETSEKTLADLIASGKVPLQIKTFEPNLTFDSYVARKKKELQTIKDKVQSNNCTTDSSVKLYNRQRCLDLDKKITNQIDLINNMGRRLLQLDVTQNVSLNYQIDAQKKLLQDMKSEYDKNGCLLEVEAKKQETVMGVIDEYTAFDKARIEAQSIYERNKKVFYGSMVLILGFTLILTFKKK
jgi:neutral trehalase